MPDSVIKSDSLETKILKILKGHSVSDSKDALNDCLELIEIHSKVV